ncbi:MAG: hypothetical protein ACOC1P_04130 [Minisyncoccales bacterium]
MVDYKKQGKRNQINGRIFENKTREDLEKKGFIVSRWCNNVEFEKGFNFPKDKFENCNGKCIPSKQGRYRKTSTGFPDFIAYKMFREPKSNEEEIQKRKKKMLNLAIDSKKWDEDFVVEYIEDAIMPRIIFVECKVAKYLDKEEKEKAKWYLENGFCNKFLVAYKTKDPNDKRKTKVNYKEFK